MLQHSYKKLEEAYQRGVNKEHKPNPAITHPMSSQQGKGCPEMPITQTEPAQYSPDSQSDSDQDFDVTIQMWKARGWMAPIATLRMAMHRTTQGQRPTAWTSTDIKECPVTYRTRALGIAAVQPAKKMKSGTSEVSWTKHIGMHEACQMTSEN